jgi:regulatory protein
MPKITKLERQKHDPARVSVFVDGEYSFSVSDELIIEYNVSSGKDASSLPLDVIMREDEYKRCISAAFKHASVSEKTEKQMRDFLLRKEFSPQAIDKTIARLKELDYINDLNYAVQLAGHSSSGVRALKYKLRSKGVSESDINAALENETEEMQIEKALKLAKKQIDKYLKYPLYERKRRLNGYLLNHGFDFDVAAQVIEKLLNDED